MIQRIIIFGKPGSGKGTQAKELSRILNIFHIDVGSIIREEIKNETEFGIMAKEYCNQGKLVPDLETSKMITIFFLKNFNKLRNGFVIEGFPRTLFQLGFLEQTLEQNNLKINTAVFLNISDEIIFRRIKKRFQSEARKDDGNEKAIKERIRIFNSETWKCIEFYEKKGILKRIDGSKTIQEVLETILKALKS